MQLFRAAVDLGRVDGAEQRPDQRQQPQRQFERRQQSDDDDDAVRRPRRLVGPDPREPAGQPAGQTARRGPPPPAAAPETLPRGPAPRKDPSSGLSRLVLTIIRDYKFIGSIFE